MTLLLESFVRRVPRQQRSWDRLNLILDTGAELLAEAGSERLTMALVAERSGLTPSSIYDYVLDRSDLIAAVAARGLDRFHERLATEFSVPTTPSQARDLVCSTFRASVEHYAHEVGFAEAFAAVSADPARATIDLQDSRRNAKLLAERLGPFAVEPDPELLESDIFLLVHLTGTVAAMSRSLPDKEARAVTERYEKLLCSLIRDA